MKQLGMLGALAVLAMVSCSSGSHLSASNLQIGPNPAGPGDVVMASVDILVSPVQRHTIILTIDGSEHFRATSSEAPERPFVINLGDAADLIASYGTGVHAARVEVRAEESSERARTQSAGFELRASTP